MDLRCLGQGVRLDCTNRTDEVRAMLEQPQVAGVDEARRRLPEILKAAHQRGTVTIVTNRGVPYAAVVPLPQAVQQTARLTELRGSAKGCYGDAPTFVERLRNEWP